VDTRKKIVSSEEAARIASRALVVTGYFDPLLASHAARLRELKTAKMLMVAIASTKECILPARARAELVAGLRVVDYVVESTDGLAPEVRLEQEDSARLEKLIGHVHARQQAAS
jgi:bifunctional ADP-heptose synthase (sugar kinase/adenylyltransferase)